MGPASDEVMITRRLAEFVVDTPTGDIPEAVLDGARLALVDTVGCGLAGAFEPVTRIVHEWIDVGGGKAQATVWGRPIKCAPSDAVLVNAVAAHSLDFDDSLPTLRGHPSAVIAPTALVIGEATHASGDDVLAAYALGLEVAGKLGRVIGDGHYLRGWHTTATIGAFTATTVAARLLGLDSQALQRAWGLAASQSSGLVRNFGTMTKSYNAGNAARIGVVSAYMALKGLTADPEIFDNENNFFSTYGSGDGADPESVLTLLGRPWEMINPGIFIKSWPCCYGNHRPIGGLLKLVAEHSIGTDEVTSIEIGFLPGADSALISRDPQTGLEGKFSIEYVAAALLLDGRLVLETFTDAMVRRPAVRELMAKVHRKDIPGRGMYSGLSGYTDIAINTHRGRFSTRIEFTPGSPAWPPSDAERTEKFIGNATPLMGKTGARHLFDILMDCRSIRDVGVLAEATVSRHVPRIH